MAEGWESDGEDDVVLSLEKAVKSAPVGSRLIMPAGAFCDYSYLTLLSGIFCVQVFWAQVIFMIECVLSDLFQSRKVPVGPPGSF